MTDLELIYSDRNIVKLVYRISDQERNNITDTNRLEDLIFSRICRYVKRIPERLTHTSVINRLAHQVAAQVRSEYKREHYESYDSYSIDNGEGEEKRFEPIDVLANVESEVVAKELTALLAKDGRTKIILESWTDGNDNISSISDTLARVLGGNAESHRKFIHRFKDQCHDTLAAVI